MSELSPQDLASIQAMVNVVTPKIIERLKACEASLVSMAGDIDALQKQVKPKRTSKKKEPEVPQLLAQEGADPLAQTSRPATASTSATGTPGVGIAAAMTSDANATGAASSQSLAQPQEARHGAGTMNDPANGGIAPPLEFPVVDGIQVTAQMIYGVQYILQQNYNDPAIIAQTLQLPVGVVNVILAMPVEKQAALMELAQRQAAGTKTV